MKAVVAAFNQEKALLGAFSVITNLRIELFVAHSDSEPGHQYVSPARASPITQLISDDGSIIATLLNNTLGNAADRCGFVQTRFRLIVS